MRARKAGQCAREYGRGVTNGERRETDGAHRRLRRPGRAQAQAPAGPGEREGDGRDERPGQPGQRIELRHEGAEDRNAVEEWEVEPRQHHDARRIVGAGGAVGAFQDEADETRDSHAEPEADDDLVGAQAGHDQRHQEADQPTDRSGGDDREQCAAGRGRDFDRDQRARQHHRFEAEIDETAHAIDEAADRREQERRCRQHRRVDEEVDHDAALLRAHPTPNCATAKIITAPCRISTISIGTLLKSWMFAPAEDSAPNRMDATTTPVAELRARSAIAIPVNP